MRARGHINNDNFVLLCRKPRILSSDLKRRSVQYSASLYMNGLDRNVNRNTASEPLSVASEWSETNHNDLFVEQAVSNPEASLLPYSQFEEEKAAYTDSEYQNINLPVDSNEFNQSGLEASFRRMDLEEDRSIRNDYSESSNGDFVVRIPLWSQLFELSSGNSFQQTSPSSEALQGENAENEQSSILHHSKDPSRDASFMKDRDNTFDHSAMDS